MMYSICVLFFDQSFHSFKIWLQSVYSAVSLAFIFQVILESLHIWECMLFAFTCEK